MTVEITGSASQVQTAQQLIKVFFLGFLNCISISNRPCLHFG
uniref:Uncharacterized protein n=1 Tax=Arundo donax TaxID=35708 RepID=A0A0A9HV08_ARUDO